MLCSGVYLLYYLSPLSPSRLNSGTETPDPGISAYSVLLMCVLCEFRKNPVFYIGFKYVGEGEKGRKLAALRYEDFQQKICTLKMDSVSKCLTTDFFISLFPLSFTFFLQNKYGKKGIK